MSQVASEMFGPVTAFPAGWGRRAVSEATPGAGALRVRWGRVASLVLVVALAAAVVLAWWPAAQATGGSGPRGDGAVVNAPTGALREHVVAPGDTLWALALTAAPQDDPRETVDRIMRLNGRAAGSLQVGEVILLPR